MSYGRMVGYKVQQERVNSTENADDSDASVPHVPITTAAHHQYFILNAVREEENEGEAAVDETRNAERERSLVFFCFVDVRTLLANKYAAYDAVSPLPFRSSCPLTDSGCLTDRRQGIKKTETSTINPYDAFDGPKHHSLFLNCRLSPADMHARRTLVCGPPSGVPSAR